MGLFGPPNVDKMKAKRDVEGLIKVLGYNRTLSVKENVFRSRLAAEAAAALGEIGDARTVEPLCTALSFPFVNVRQAAAGALGKIGDARAVKPLIAALKGGLAMLARSNHLVLRLRTASWVCA